MSSRLNFSIGSPVDPTQALQVSLGNIGKYFADFQDREMRREEKEAQQKRWEAENTRAEATHRMQLDEYNRKVAERDALSGVLKDPEAMRQVVEQGAFASPTALRLSNEAAAKGQLVNKDLASVAASGDPLIQKALTAQDATMRQAEALDMSTWGGPEDTAANQLGLDSDRTKVDLLERINRTASTDPRYKDVSRLAGAITTAQKNADVFGSAMMDSTTAAGRDAMTDAVLGESTKGQVRDWYLSGLVGRGVSPEQALSLAELYTKDMVTPQERAKQRLETAKTNIEMGKLLSQAYSGRGENSPVVNVNSSGGDGKIEGGEGVVYRSPNDVVNAISKDPAFKGTDILTKDTIAEVSDFVTSKLQELSKDKRFASLNNQELLGLIANSVQLSGRPTGIMDDLNNEGANTRLLADANALAAYKGGIKLDEKTKAYAERLLDSINPKQKQVKTGRLSNLTPKQQANIDYFVQNGITALSNTDKQATINDVLPRLAQLPSGVGNASSTMPQQRSVNRIGTIGTGVNVTPAQQKVLDEGGVLVGNKVLTQKELSDAAASVTSYPLRGRLATAAPVQLMDMTDELVNAPTRQEAKAIEEARKVSEAARAAKEQEVINKYSKYGNTIQEIHNNSDVPIQEVIDLLPKTENRGFIGRLMESVKDTDINKVLAGLPVVGAATQQAFGLPARLAAKAVAPAGQVAGTAVNPVVRNAPIVDNIPAVIRRADALVGPKLPVPSSAGVSTVARVGQTTPPGLVTNTNVPYINRGLPSAANALKPTQQANPTTRLAELDKASEELVRIGVPRRKTDGGFDLRKVPSEYKEAAKELNSRLAGAQ